MIPDKNLRTAIEEKLGKTAGQPITQAEMTTLMGLNAMAFNISDLTGLQFATQLTSLSLDNNNISDITPLAGLTQLTVLYLDRNNISDITPLAGLTQLTGLDLNRNSNNISDITPLAGLTQLTWLVLAYNNISDITPLAGLTQLTSLWLADNNISDITPLAGLTQLTSLALRTTIYRLAGQQYIGHHAIGRINPTDNAVACGQPIKRGGTHRPHPRPPEPRGHGRTLTHQQPLWEGAVLPILHDNNP